MRWESAGEGEYTIERVDRAAARHRESTLHLREGQDELLSRWRLAAIIRKYSDHIALPILMRKEVWDEEKKALPRRPTRTRPSTRPRRCGRGRSRTSRPSSTTSSTSTSRTTARRRSRTCTRRVEGRTEYTLLLYVPARRAVRPVGPRASPRRQALRAARVHHGRRRAAAAAVPALRPRRRRLATTCRSTCRARSCRSRATSRRSAAAASSACSTCSRISPRTTRRSTRRSGREFGNVLKEGFVDDHGNREKLAQARALRVDARAAATRRTCALAEYVGADEGRPDRRSTT